MFPTSLHLIQTEFDLYFIIFATLKPLFSMITCYIPVNRSKITRTFWSSHYWSNEIIHQLYNVKSYVINKLILSMFPNSLHLIQTEFDLYFIISAALNPMISTPLTKGHMIFHGWRPMGEHTKGAKGDEFALVSAEGYSWMEISAIGLMSQKAMRYRVTTTILVYGWLMLFVVDRRGFRAMGSGKEQQWYYVIYSTKSFFIRFHTKNI